MSPKCHYGENFISFHDLTPEAHFLWASPSIEDCLGYKPDELLDVSPYDLLVKDDIPETQTVHTENVLNDMVATQVTVRYRHKDGSAVPILCIFSVCYEYIVTCMTVLQMDGTPFKTRNAHSIAMTRIVQSRQEEFARIKRHHKAFKARSWNAQGLEPEFRVCMILNRYSRTLGVLYASPSCELVLRIDAEAIVGKPFLLFIRADDLGAFVEQVNVAKSTAAITHMRFWFQSPNWPQEIPCEATLFSSADGLVMIMRRCRPFVRRRMIGHADMDERASTSESSSLELDNDGQYMRSTSSTPVSVFKPTSWNDERQTWSPARKVFNASISRIIELDGDKDLKPMIPVMEDDSRKKDEPAVQLEDQRYFRQHVQMVEEPSMSPRCHYGKNFLSFHDLTPEALFLWASPSIEDCVGYTPDEVLNVSAYDLLIKEDIPNTQTVHTENVLNDMVATQVTEFARIKRHHKAFKARSWNAQGLEPEFRVCMILNRYSRTLGVLYASPSCELVLRIDAEAIIGKPFLLFIRADDLGAFVEQVNVAKSTAAITHMRFWFQSPNWPQEIPCEATLFSAADGLIVVMRQCRPFVRRRLIGSVDMFEKAHSSPSSTDSAQSMVWRPQPPISHDDQVRKTQTSYSKLFNTSISRIIELGDDDCKPILSFHKSQRSKEEESAAQQEGQQYFRQHHVQVDSDEEELVEETFKWHC
ncbi:hypothetical protein BGZ75_000592 [Mortierella antarctica]|nr:hypothetical protein BGZ75_000592 [Mortierella antarctica]